jgi:prepilin-type processing-associated H-X9-DG protein
MKTQRHGGKAVTVYADGSITIQRGGAGAIVLDASGAVVLLANRVLPTMTSSEAEYAGLILGMELALKAEAVLAEIRLDSEVVVNQMAGYYAVNSPRLKTLHWQACDLARQFARIIYVHVPREENALADALATEASAGREWRLA